VTETIHKIDLGAVLIKVINDFFINGGYKNISKLRLIFLRLTTYIKIG